MLILETAREIMAYTKSRKVHLRKFRVDVERQKLVYRKRGSFCGTADIDTSKIEDFRRYLKEFPNDVCKNCVKKHKEISEEIKRSRKA